MKKPKFKLQKKTLLAIVGVAIVLVVAIGIGVLARLLQTGAFGNQPSQNNVSPNSPYAKSPYPDAVNQAQSQSVAGNNQAAQDTIAKALAQPNVNNDDKFLLLQQQGVVYTNENKPQQALDVFLQALPLKPTDHTINQLIAEQYEALGNKDKAIEFYKNTVKYLDTKSPMYNFDKQEYEDKIRSLGGTP